MDFNDIKNSPLSSFEFDYEGNNDDYYSFNEKCKAYIFEEISKLSGRRIDFEDNRCVSYQMEEFDDDDECFLHNKKPKTNEVEITGICIKNINDEEVYTSNKTEKTEETEKVLLPNCYILMSCPIEKILRKEEDINKAIEYFNTNFKKNLEEERKTIEDQIFFVINGYYEESFYEIDNQTLYKVCSSLNKSIKSLK